MGGSRPESPPERYSADSSRTCDSRNTTSTTASNKYTSSETLSHRSSSEPQSDPSYQTMMESEIRSHHRKSFTASDSSLEEMEGSDLMNRRRSHRSLRSLKQERSLPSEEDEMDHVLLHHDQMDPSCNFRYSSDSGRHDEMNRGIGYNDMMGGMGAGGAGGHHQNRKPASVTVLRQIASDAALYLDSGHDVNSLYRRRRSDSPSSDYSDHRNTSPPDRDSMSPSSPDYVNRSPRQSADSDLLMVNLCESNFL